MTTRRKAPLLVLAVVVAGCDDGDVSAVTCDVAADTTGCDAVLNPTGDVQGDVQRALIEAQSGSDVCFCPGTFSFEKELSLSVPDITLRGLGATRDDVVLDFAAQTVGDDGVTVTGDGFTIENMSIKNTPGNGIVVTGADDVTFRNLLVSWDAGSVTENGAYAVYPVTSRRVLVEDSEIVGAADAGIYVGQCEQAIVRNNVVHGNVAGIEIENSADAEVHGNESYDNSAGILVFVLPNLERKEGNRAKVHDNQVYDNNRESFAEEGTIVASVPVGTGVLVLAADDTEIHDNTIEDNGSTGVLVVSFVTLSVLIPDIMLDETDPDPERTHVHDNVFANNGASPQGALGFLGIAPLEDVIWDGVEKEPDPKNTSAELCLGESPPSFRDFAGVPGISDDTLHSTDTGLHECSLEALSEVSF